MSATAPLMLTSTLAHGFFIILTGSFRTGSLLVNELLRCEISRNIPTSLKTSGPVRLFVGIHVRRIRDGGVFSPLSVAFTKKWTLLTLYVVRGRRQVILQSRLSIMGS